MNIPPIIAAGDSPSWDDHSFFDNERNSISSANYTLKYSFRGAVGGCDVTATSRGSGWTASLSAVQTAAMNAGAIAILMFWQAYATGTAGRLLAGEGRLQVKPNLATLDVSMAFDGTSPAEKILAAIETEIAGRLAGNATIEYTIGTRSLKKEPMANLLSLRQTYKLIVLRERRRDNIKNGLGNPSRVGVRFGGK